MIEKGKHICPKCGCELQSRGSVKRKIRKEYGKVTYIKIKRYSCKTCGAWHRELPKNILPYKQYSKDIVDSFMYNELSTDDLEFENYPVDITVERWKTKK